MPEKDDKSADVYHSFQEFCQPISKLNLSVGWSINISEYAYIKESDDIQDLAQFLKSEHLHCLNHQTMTIIPHKYSVKNITLANLIKVLSSYKLCTGVENEIAEKSTPHTIPHNIKHCSTSLIKPNI